MDPVDAYLDGEDTNENEHEVTIVEPDLRNEGVDIPFYSNIGQDTEHVIDILDDHRDLFGKLIILEKKKIVFKPKEWFSIHLSVDNRS